MATSMANPQAAAPGPEQDQGGGMQQGGGQQANPLQTALARVAMMVTEIGRQNTVIQPEMQQCRQILISALQKASQASPGAPQPLQAPPQG